MANMGLWSVPGALCCGCWFRSLLCALHGAADPCRGGLGSAPRRLMLCASGLGATASIVGDNGIRSMPSVAG